MQEFSELLNRLQDQNFVAVIDDRDLFTGIITREVVDVLEEALGISQPARFKSASGCNKGIFAPLSVARSSFKRDD